MVAGLAGLKVALVVFVELDLAASGDFDPLLDPFMGLELGHDGASCVSPRNNAATSTSRRSHKRSSWSSQGGVKRRL